MSDDKKKDVLPEALSSKYLSEIAAIATGLVAGEITPKMLLKTLDGYQRRFADTDSRLEEACLLRMGGMIFDMGVTKFGRAAMAETLNEEIVSMAIAEADRRGATVN